MSLEEKETLDAKMKAVGGMKFPDEEQEEERKQSTLSPEEKERIKARMNASPGTTVEELRRDINDFRKKQFDAAFKKLQNERLRKIILEEIVILTFIYLGTFLLVSAIPTTYVFAFVILLYSLFFIEFGNQMSQNEMGGTVLVALIAGWFCFYVQWSPFWAMFFTTAMNNLFVFFSKIGYRQYKSALV